MQKEELQDFDTMTCFDQLGFGLGVSILTLIQRALVSKYNAVSIFKNTNVMAS